MAVVEIGRWWACYGVWRLSDWWLLPAVAEQAHRCLLGNSVRGLRPLALSGSSVCRSGGQSRMGEGEGVAERVRRGHGHLDAADRPADLGADFAQGAAQLGHQPMPAAEVEER